MSAEGLDGQQEAARHDLRDGDPRRRTLPGASEADWPDESGRDCGAVALEYSLMLVLVAFVVIISVTAVGGLVFGLFTVPCPLSGPCLS